MSTEEEEGPKRVKMYRIVPQVKTFKTGTLLKNKVDLYYSLEPDIVETGGEDNFSPFALQGGAGGGNSFPQSSQFIPKESTLMFVEAAQFRASDNNVYVRLQLISGDKVFWVNVLKKQNREWAFLIRRDQKKLIREEIENMFEVLHREE